MGWGDDSVIEIKFSGTSAENVLRQIAAFLEKAEEKGDKNGRGKKKQTAGGSQGDMG